MKLIRVLPILIFVIFNTLFIGCGSKKEVIPDSTVQVNIPAGDMEEQITRLPDTQELFADAISLIEEKNTRKQSHCLRSLRMKMHRQRIYWYSFVI